MKTVEASRPARRDYGIMTVEFLIARGKIMTDAELVRRVAAGEQEAFGELVERHHAQVIGLCASMLRDPAAAEDAAQDVFVKAFQSLDKFLGGASFGTWVYRIAYNHCLDAMRRRARSKTESLEAMTESAGTVKGALGGGRREDRAAEDADLARRVLDQLPEQHRLALVLREVEGLSCEELAETFDCSITAMKARLRRARLSLDQIAHRYFAGGVN